MLQILTCFSLLDFQKKNSHEVNSAVNMLRLHRSRKTNATKSVLLEFVADRDISDNFLCIHCIAKKLNIITKVNIAQYSLLISCQ